MYLLDEALTIIDLAKNRQGRHNMLFATEQNSS
jgi:hypothetical protein